MRRRASQNPQFQNKGGFRRQAGRNAHFCEIHAPSLPSIEQNFYFVQLSMDFKMPLPFLLFRAGFQAF